MKNTMVKRDKLTEALTLDVKTASREQLASALLVLNPLSLKVQSQLKSINYELEKANNMLRQSSMFEDETFSNTIDTATFTEVETASYTVDRVGILKKAGVSTSKVNDFISVTPIVSQKTMINLKKAGTLDPAYSEFIKEFSVKQVAIAFGKEAVKEEK